MRLLSVLLVLALSGGGFSTLAWEIRYNIVPLETDRLPYVGATFATDISDSGWITGLVFPAAGSPYGGYQTAFSYHPTTGFLDLGNIPGYNLSASGINDQGQICGQAWDTSRQWSFLYTPGTGFTPLGESSENEAVGAREINFRGMVVGNMDAGGGNIQAYVYSPSSGMRPLGTLGGARSYGHAINDAGWVVGTSQVADGGWRAFLYRDDLGMLDLGPGYASGINNLGIAAGVSEGRPAMFRDGQVIFVGNPAGRFTYVSDLNDHGVLVGGYDDLQSGGRHTFLGTEADGLVDLNSLIDPASGWRVTDAFGINNAGQIVGVGAFQGSAWAIRLDPIPEPSTWALLAVGGGLIWLWRRGRGRRLL